MKKQRVQKKKSRDFLKTKKKEVVDYFPRGGGSEMGRDYSDFTFNTAMVDRADTKGPKFLKKKRKLDSDKPKDTEEIDYEAENVTTFDKEEGSTSRALLPKFKIGDLVLLTISEIRKDYMIANYTRNKKAMIHTNYSGLASSNPNFSFTEHFKVGQFVCGAVVSPGNDIQLSTGYMNKKILVSIDPKIVNTGLRADNLVEGMDLYGKLVKDEESGTFTVDFGLTNVEEEIEKFNQGKKKASKFDFDDEEEDEGENENEFSEGDENFSEDDQEEDFDIEKYSKINKKRKVDSSKSTAEYEVRLTDNEESPEILQSKLPNSYYFFKIISIEKTKEKTILTVSLNYSKYKFPIKKCAFKFLRPGFLFKATETRELVNGVEAAFAGNIGSIFSDQKKTNSKGRNIMTRIIHVSVSKGAVSLSSKRHVVNLHVEDIEKKKSLIGTTFEGVKVEDVLFGNAYQVTFNTGEGNNLTSAFLHPSQTDNRENKLEKDNIIPKVLVKEYNFFDDRAMLTAKKEALSLELVTWENIYVGKFVKGMIEEIRNDGLIVRLNSFIEGKLPKEHITDYPLSKMPKKYKHGQTISCRIFAFDYTTKYLILTTKESLMDDKAVLTSDISQIREGEDINVVYIGNALFQHSGDIMGKLINFNKLQAKENFKVGKLYVYKVYKIAASKTGGKSKLYLTNEAEVWQPGVGDYDSLLKRNPILSTIAAVLNFNKDSEAASDLVNNVQPGNIYDFTIITSKKLVKLLIKHGVDPSTIQDNVDTITKNFLIARHEESNVYGFIPQELVSDFYQEKIIQILTKIKSNSTQMLVLYSNPDSRVFFLTPKKSLIENVNDIPSSKQNMINEHLYYGFVNKRVKNGFVLQFLEGQKAVVKSKISTATITNPGQTIIAKCKLDEKDSGKKRFDVSSVYSQTIRQLDDLKDESMEYIQNYLHDLNLIVENKNMLHDIKVNSKIEGKIGIVKEYGLLVGLKVAGATSGITGFLKNEHMKGEYKVGETHKFRVIDLDFIDNIVYLTDNVEEDTPSSTSTQDFYDSNKNKESSFNFIIELFHDNYISLCLEDNPKVKALMPCNLYNYNYEASQLSDMFKIGDVVASKIGGFSQQLEKLILEPIVKLLTKIQASLLTKEKHKNIISTGNIIKGRINGVKGAYVYVYIDKNTLGRIHLNDFAGNVEDIKGKLKQWHAAVGGEAENQSHSNANVSLSRSASELFPEELKVKCKILHVEQKKNVNICDLITVTDESLKFDLEKKPLDLSGMKANVGIISRIDILNKYPIKIDFNSTLGNNNKVQIHFSYIPVDKFTNIRSAYRVGDKIAFYSRPDSESDSYVHSLSPFPKEGKSESPFTLEKVYPVRILKPIPGRGLIVDLSLQGYHTEAFVDICEISDDLHPNPLNLFKTGSLTIGRILTFDSKANKYFLSLRNSIVDEEYFDILKNGSTLKYNKKFDYFEKVADFRNKIFKFGAQQVIEQNLVAIGYITSSSEKGVFIKLASDVIVRASLRELTDEKTTKPFLLFKQDSLVLCRVISIYRPEGKSGNNKDTSEASKLNINVSLRESVVKYNLTLRTKDLVVNNFYLCTIMNEAENKFEVCIVGSTFTGLLKRKHIKEKTFSSVKNAMENQEQVLLQVVKLDKNVHPPKLRFSNQNVENIDTNIVINALSKEEEEKNKVYAELYQNVKDMNEKYNQDEISYELKELEKNADKIDYESLLNSKVGKEEESEESEEEKEEEEMMEEEEEIGEELILDHEIKSQFLKGLGISLDKGEEDKMDVEVEDLEEETETKNLKSSKKREKEHLKAELIIRQKEAESANMDKMEDKESVEYYEKQILSEPNNSLYWIQYAAYILDKLNLNGARKIFERAITTINIASIKEKMNVWIAYMNLENTYGTQETFKSVVERALEVNDKKTVYKHLISIYKLSGKYDLAYEVYKIITKNFFSDFIIWKNYLEFLFEVESVKQTSNDYNMKNKFGNIFIEPKEGLNRALQVLGKSKRVDMLIFYGQLQYKYNFIEEARNTFESILKNYPKRSDIWIVYIDKEIKHTQNLEKIRSIFEKLLNSDLKIKILKTVIKKYLEFEREFGNAKSMEYVKNLTQKLIMEKMSNLQGEEEDDQMQVDS